MYTPWHVQSVSIETISNKIPYNLDLIKEFDMLKILGAESSQASQFGPTAQVIVQIQAQSYFS